MAAAATAALLALVAAQPAAGQERVLVDESFAAGTLPAGWTPVLGQWQVVDGRLQASTGNPRARIAFGPAAPAAFKLEATVRFVTVTNPARWLNFGVDYHAADDYGAVVVARSATTASNGLELAQAAKGGGYTSSPVGPAPVAIGTGQDHKLAVEVRGTQLEVSIDGRQALTATNLKRTGGGFAFVINNSTVQFDDVKVTELEAQATAPAAPRNLKLSEVGDTATVTWSAPENAGANADGSPATIARYEASIADGPWQTAEGFTHTFTNVPAAEQEIRVRAVNSAGVAGPVASVRTLRGAPTVDGYKLQVSGGAWPSGHVQGIAVDPAKGWLYYSFTNLLVKTDFAGNVVGTMGGFTGHLGDLDFNPADGRVYGSLEYKAAKAFYIAIFDVDRIDRVGMTAQSSAIVSTVHLPEVVEDFTADMDGNGVFDGDTANTPDHRYGASGIDGVAFGPRLGSLTGPAYLTVAYGIYANPSRADNDHQVLLQYDPSDWRRFERPLVESAPHRDGPAEPDGKFFVFTGNTTYGVQNLEYDPWLERWFLGVYTGTKPQYPNYGLYAVDAESTPVLTTLQGLGGERGLLVGLAEDGLEHAATGIRGWRQKADVGIQSLGHGLFYLATNGTQNGNQTATLKLEAWTGNPNDPFAPVTADYRVAPTFTSSAPSPAQTGRPYTHAFTGRAFPDPTFALAAGELPPGLALGPEGRLTGTPTTPGRYAFTVAASNGHEEARQDVLLTVVPAVAATVGGHVPSVLSLTLDGPATFGVFTPGIARDYTAVTGATVTSSAGDATLTVSDPGHLTNGAYALASPLAVTLSKGTWDGPVGNDRVTVTFNQRIEAHHGLRAGDYAKTVTLTLSTATP